MLIDMAKDGPTLLQETEMKKYETLDLNDVMDEARISWYDKKT